MSVSVVASPRVEPVNLSRTQSGEERLALHKNHEGRAQAVAASQKWRCASKVEMSLLPGPGAAGRGRRYVAGRGCEVAADPDREGAPLGFEGWRGACSKLRRARVPTRALRPQIELKETNRVEGNESCLQSIGCEPLHQIPLNSRALLARSEGGWVEGLHLGAFAGEAKSYAKGLRIL